MFVWTYFQIRYILGTCLFYSFGFSLTSLHGQTRLPSTQNEIAKPLLHGPVKQNHQNFYTRPYMIEFTIKTSDYSVRSIMHYLEFPPPGLQIYPFIGAHSAQIWSQNGISQNGISQSNFLKFFFFSSGEVMGVGGFWAWVSVARRVLTPIPPK